MNSRQSNMLQPSFGKSCQIENISVYSSVVLGPRAFGTVDLFTYPKGYPVPRLGTVSDRLFSCATGMHTNLNKAGEYGSGIGDFAAQSLAVDFTGGSLSEIQEIYENCYFEVRVAARVKDHGSLQRLPIKRDVALIIARTDTLLVEFQAKKALKIKTPIMVRFMLDGLIKYDAT